MSSEDVIAFFRSDSIRNFLAQQKGTDLKQLPLKRPPNLSFEQWQSLMWHLQNLEKVQNKIPTWSASETLIFPFESTALEQSSSEATAIFKSQIVKGEKLIDLTGGLGVDSFFFAQHFQTVYHIEPNRFLQEIMQHNFEILHQKNIFFDNREAESFLKKNDFEADIFYLDPSRRNLTQERLIKLEDYSPNMLAMLPFFKNKNMKILLKTSPMISIPETIVKLFNVKKVWAVAVGNELKEVLFLLDFEMKTQPELSAVILNKAGEVITLHTITAEEERLSAVYYSKPKKYIYEPHRTLMKLGVFKWVAQTFALEKLHPNSHLYTSETLVEHFTGNIFEVLAIEKYDKKGILKHIPEKKAWLKTRNFPDEVATIRKKWNIREGGEKFIIFTTNSEEQRIAIISKKV